VLDFRFLRGPPVAAGMLGGSVALGLIGSVTGPPRFRVPSDVNRNDCHAQRGRCWRPAVVPVITPSACSLLGPPGVAVPAQAACCLATSVVSFQTR
jgi:hypothetical protein